MAWRDVTKRPSAGTCSAGWRPGTALHACLLTLALAAGAAARAAAPYALIGKTAPDFALHAASGGNVRLSEHRGEVVVLSFWSSRCTACRTQLAALSRSLATYRSAELATYGANEALYLQQLRALLNE